jgi:hypothetical protein
MRQMPAMAGAAMLGLLVWPARSLATLDGSNSGSTASARYTGNFVGPTVTSSPDQVKVEIFNSANETLELGPLYMGDFAYESTIVGTGTVTYGSAAGTIETEASATPESVEPAKNNQNGPAYNQDASAVDATFHLIFQEDGVVTGGAPGTPVTLAVNLMVQAMGIMVGGHPSFDRLTLAWFTGRIIDESVGGGSVDHTVYGNGLATLDLATAVGHTLSIEGHLYLHVEGVAGGSQGSFGFFEQYLGSIDATVAGLWMDAPAGIGIAAPSGYDYTVPLPEPGRPLLLLLGAGALFLRCADVSRAA